MRPFNSFLEMYSWATEHATGDFGCLFTYPSYYSWGERFPGNVVRKIVRKFEGKWYARAIGERVA